MRYSQLIESPKGITFVQGKGLLCNRVGPANSQKQKHKEGNTAPVNRGVWAFPWPINDYYFSFHQTHKLVKKYEKYDDSEIDPNYLPQPYQIVPDKKWKELVKGPMKTKQIWWNKPLYSHIPPFHKVPEARWYLWDDLKRFAETIERERFSFEKSEIGFTKNKIFCRRI